MLLMTSNLNRNSHSKNLSKKEDRGTCLNCKNQGTGDLACRSCIRNSWAKKKEKDNFQLK